MNQAQLWVIHCGGSNRWSDDRGGDLFTSEAMARRTFDKYRAALDRVGAKIVLCGLDDDLAQIGDLYHEGAKPYV